MQVEQFVMAYEAEQDRLRALLPEGFISLRPVLRFNAEILDGRTATLEFNTAAEKDGIRGWVNIGSWENVPFTKIGSSTCFLLPELKIDFTAVGMEGSCPAEKDNQGCFFDRGEWVLRKPEIITSRKEYCVCSFGWKIPGGAHAKSHGKTLPAFYQEPRVQYPKLPLTVENAAVIPCAQVLGTYVVRFDR